MSIRLRLRWSLIFLKLTALAPLAASPTLSPDAVDWIEREAPSLKVRLGKISPEEGNKLVATYVNWLSSALGIPSKEAVRAKVESVLSDLERQPHWKDRIPKITPLQRRISDFYFTHMKFSFADSYMADSWVSQLDIDLPYPELTAVQKVEEQFKTHEAFFLRPLARSQKPKLVIGCGDRRRTEPSRDYRPNPHTGDDTIDPILRRNPSIVGFFGGNQESEEVTAPSIIPENNYQTIFDEGLFQLTPAQWKEVERDLKPGGFFLGYTSIKEKLPRGTKLRVHSIAEIKSRFDCPTHYEISFGKSSEPGDSLFEKALNLNRTAYLIFTKPKVDGTLAKFTAEDLPFGMTLVKERKISLKPSLYIEEEL